MPRDVRQGARSRVEGWSRESASALRGTCGVPPGLGGFVRNRAGGVPRVEGESEALGAVPRPGARPPRSPASREIAGSSPLRAAEESRFPHRGELGGRPARGAGLAGRRHLRRLLARDVRSRRSPLHHPFLNCTNCGPRLTVVTGAPYDRERTTMARLPLRGVPSTRIRRTAPSTPSRRVARDAGHASGARRPRDGGGRIRSGRVAARELSPRPHRRHQGDRRLPPGLRRAPRAGGGRAVCAARSARRKPFAVMVRDLEPPRLCPDRARARRVARARSCSRPPGSAPPSLAQLVP